MADVFISYKKEEKAKAQLIADALNRLCVSTWLDAQLEPGRSFSEEIRDELAKCKAQVVCWSQASITSEWVRGEAELGRQRGILVPVLLEPCELLPPFNMLHAELLSEWTGDDLNPNWRNVLRRLGLLLGRPGLSELASLLPAGNEIEWRAWSIRYPLDPAMALATEKIGNTHPPEASVHSEVLEGPEAGPASPPTLASLLAAAEAADFRLRVFRDAAKKYGWQSNAEEKRLELEALALRAAVAKLRDEQKASPPQAELPRGFVKAFLDATPLTKASIMIMGGLSAFAAGVALVSMFMIGSDSPTPQVDRTSPSSETAANSTDEHDQPAAPFDTSLLGPLSDDESAFQGDYEALGLDPTWAAQFSDDHAEISFPGGTSYSGYSGQREARTEGAQFTYSLGTRAAIVVIQRPCRLLNGVQTDYSALFRVGTITYEGCARRARSEHWPPWDHAGSVFWRYDPRPFDEEYDADGM